MATKLVKFNKRHNRMDIDDLNKNDVDELVDDYLSSLGMVAISKTNCPICGEDFFNGWRCTCLSEEAQTKFMWRVQ